MLSQRILQYLPAHRFKQQWLLGALCLIFSVAIFQRLLSPINHDSSWILYFSKQMIEGATPYVDLIEINPPLVFWLMSIPAWVSQETGIDLGQAGQLFVFVCAALSVWLSFFVASRLPLTNKSVLLIAIAYLITVFPGGSFAQREHLLLIFIAPLLLLLSARLQNTMVPNSLIMIVSLWGAVGLLLKPYFLLLLVVPEVYLLVRLGWRRSLFRLEHFVMLAAATFYLLSIYFITPEYLSRIVRYGSEVYQIGYVGSTLLMVAVSIVLCIGAYLIFVMVRERLGFNPIDPVIAIFSFAAVGAFLSFIIQFKGWYYHYWPVIALLSLVAIIAITDDRLGAVNRARHDKSSLIFTVLILGVLAYPLVQPKYDNPTTQYWGKRLDQFPDLKSFAVFSANVPHGFPLATERNLTWASRFPCLWLVPGTQKRRAELGTSTPLLDEIAAYNRAAVAEDLQKFTPGVVLVDRNETKSRFDDLKFDYVADFSRDENFKKQWASYRFVDEQFGFALFVRDENGR